MTRHTLASLLALLILLLPLTAACASTAAIRVPVGGVAVWAYHAPQPCAPTWQTSRPAVAHVSADAQEPFVVMVLGRTPGRAQVRVVCGNVTHVETVEVFRAR